MQSRSSAPMEEERREMEISPTIFVIFGGAGDLAWRKLIPSLFDLHRDGRMPQKFAIIPVDRAPFRDAELHKHFLDGVKRFSRTGKVKSSDWKTFAKHIIYQQGDFKDALTYSNVKRSEEHTSELQSRGLIS